jgi:hypothetical protein
MPHSICVVAVPVLFFELCSRALRIGGLSYKKGLEDWSGSGTRPCDMCVVRERPTYEVRIHLLHALQLQVPASTSLCTAAAATCVHVWWRDT